MSARVELLQSIASTIADYRLGEIPSPTPDHIETWITQFDTAVQETLLAELNHVLARTYIPKAEVEKFVAGLVRNPVLAGSDPCSFWKSVLFLSIQNGGNSQREMLALFSAVLERECGLRVSDCGSDPQLYLYLDDAVFSGNRIRNDLSTWIRSSAPSKVEIEVVTIASHRGGQYYANGRIAEAASDAGKELTLRWRTAIEIEDRRAYTTSSDVLRPVHLPDDELTIEYASTLGYPITWRTPGNAGANGFFSSEDGRHLLEQELLKAGARIRSECPNLNVYQRPLGNMVLQTLGFGSLLVTFRNCPNNCPLAFWVGAPWYPLFPRKTN